MDFDNKTPVYLQIINKIIDDILAGKYNMGERIPSIRELAKDYVVNQNTVMHSYKELERDGIIESKRGLGYFITEDVSKIKELKKIKIKETINVFFDSMRSAGFTNDEILDLIIKELKQ